MRHLLVVFLLGFGCSSTSSTAVRLADGSWHLTCKSPLGSCVQKAEQICKAQSYAILRGRNEHKTYGHELGESQIVADRSELVVRCVGDAPVPMPPVQGGGATGEPVPGAHPMKAPVSEPRPAATICTKGSTQACVGPGACAGGQVCLADGSGFGPCDCGPAPSPASTP